MPRQKLTQADIYHPAEVARIFRVDIKTVSRWAIEGRIPEDKISRTPGGRRLFDGPYIRSLLAGGQR